MAGLERGRLLAGPGRERVNPGEDVGEDARNDLVLALEVEIEGRLLDPEPFGDLAQRHAVLAVLGEELERDPLDTVAGPVSCRLLGVRTAWLAHSRSPLKSLPNLLDDR